MARYLELEFNGTSLTPTNTSGEVEWVGGSEYYEVKVNITNEAEYDYFHLILADGSNKQVIEVDTAYLKGYSYWGKFYVPRVMGNNTLVNIGIIAKVQNANNTISSAPCPAIIKSGIAQPTPFTLDGEDSLTNSGFTTLLNLLEGGLVIKTMSLEDRVENGKKQLYLKVDYKTKNEDYTSYLGPINYDLIQLGAQIKRENNTGGGAKLGYNAKLQLNKDGFAGGYNARACSGVAIGPNAYTNTGVAIGQDAHAEPSNSRDGIAIGQKAIVDSGSQSSIAIGDHSQVVSSPRSIVIGGVTITEDQRHSIVKDSERAVGIGYNTKIKKMRDGIVLGTNTIGRGSDCSRKQDAIVVGREAKGALSGGIAIGAEATAGFKERDKVEIPDGNLKDEGSHAFAGIAIGFRSLARRGASVAIGRNSKTYRWGTVAIGTDSIAGYTNTEAKGNYSLTKDDESNTEKNYGYCAVAVGAGSEAKGTRSVALGYNSKTYNYSSVAIGNYAVVKANGAVQLGNGINSKEESLQFRDVTIVNSEQKLVVNLTKDAIGGTLPISKGGTGGNTTVEAQKELGIYTGQAKVTLKPDNNKKNNPAATTITVYYKKKGVTIFDQTPIVNLTLVGSDIDKVYNYSLALKSADTEKFEVRVGVNSISKARTYYVNWTAIGKRDKNT